VWRHADRVKRLADPLGQLSAAQAEVRRAERHILRDRGQEQLVVWILEDDAHSPADLREAATVPLVDSHAANRHGAGRSLQPGPAGSR
jgi:hypothetical protein